MKRIMMSLLMVVVIPAMVFAGVTRKVVDKYPDVSKGELTLPGQPETVIYLNSKGKEIAKELYNEDGSIMKATGKIPDGIVKEYYEGGELLAEYNYKDGKLEGLSKGYYANGVFRGEWNYKGGKLDGVIKAYDDKGNLNYEITYKDDVLNGLGKYYRENGTVFYDWHFKDGQKEGISRRYYEDGKIQIEETYKDGQVIGTKRYDRKGELVK